MRVYHLSGAQFALNNIALRRIKISRFSDLNDPFELLAADLRNKQDRRTFRRLKEEIHNTTGLLCFSRSWENPVLWSHYAEKHGGVCLGFDVPDRLLKPVFYTAKPMGTVTNGESNSLELSKRFRNALLCTKYADWKYEDELRLFVPLHGHPSEAGLYFHHFSTDLILREVILGPRCTLPMNAVRELVAKFSPRVFVVKSRLAFTKFKVVEKRAATRRRSGV